MITMYSQIEVGDLLWESGTKEWWFAVKRRDHSTDWLSLDSLRVSCSNADEILIENKLIVFRDGKIIYIHPELVWP